MKPSELFLKIQDLVMDKKITWYKMLNRFAPDDIVQEKFKLPSFNHVLLQRKDTKMYQIIFLSSLIYAPIYIHLPALAS